MTPVLRIGTRAVSLVFCAAAIVGCSSLPSWMGIFSKTEKVKPAELTPNPASINVRQAWTGKLGPVNFPLDVQVSGANFVVGSNDGTVAAIDGATGRELWRANAGNALSAGVGTDGTTTAVVTRNNDVVAFNDGKESWRQRLVAGAYTAPFVAGGRVFVLTGDRAVSAFDGKTGRKLWTTPTPRTPEPLVLRHGGVLLAVGDTLVVGLSGRLVGVNPLTGAARWEAPVATSRGINDVERLVDLVGRVSRVGDIVCARAFQAAVGCVDAGRGLLQWTRPANGSEGVHGDDTMVFGSESDGKMVAWRRSDGERAWQTELLAYRGLTAPLVLGRSVVVGDAQGFVHMLSREDGKLLNRLPTDGSAIAAAPVVVGNTLVVVTRNGGLYGFVPQ